MEHIVRVIRPFEIEQALIVGSEGQRNALLLPHIQQIDIPLYDALTSSAHRCPHIVVKQPLIMERSRLPSCVAGLERTILQQAFLFVGEASFSGCSATILGHYVYDEVRASYIPLYWLLWISVLK
jgi:hypothetical protein